MALEKMNAYYNDNPEIKAVVDGTNPDCNTCIFAFEGLGNKFGAIPSGKENEEPYKFHKDPYYFLNALMVVTRGKTIQYATGRASTLPDFRPESVDLQRTTTLADGIYDYKTGNHGKYIALRPKTSDWKSWYHNGTNFVPGVASGINLHGTSKTPLTPVTGAHSQGCQTVYWEDYISFGKAVGFLKDITYPNIKYDKVNNYLESTIGKYYTPEEIAKNPDLTTNGIGINVKYIVDREHNAKNINSLYPEGVFHPISEE